MGQAINHRLYETLHGAAFFTKINEYNGTSITDSIIPWMEYRAKVARRLLSPQSVMEEEQLKELYTYCNNQIKNALYL